MVAAGVLTAASTAPAEAWPSWWIIPLSVGVVLFNALFVAYEFCLLAAEPDRLTSGGVPSGRLQRWALEAVGDLRRQLAASQLAITSAALILGAMAEPALERVAARTVFGWDALPGGVRHAGAFVLALLIVASIHMILGEVVPKNLALANPEKLLMWLAPAGRTVTVLTRPVVWTLAAVAAGGSRLLGVPPPSEEAPRSPAELAVLLEEAHQGGELSAEERARMMGALDLLRRRAMEGVVPWDKVVSVSITDTVADAEKAITASGHSRVIVVGAKGHVFGYLHAKDLLTVGGEESGQRLDPMLLREVVRAEIDDDLWTVLRSMRRDSRHVAVLYEESRPCGLLTLEDIIERVSGAIHDESDPAGSVGHPRG